MEPDYWGAAPRWIIVGGSAPHPPIYALPIKMWLEQANSDSGLSRSTVANIVYSIDIDCKPP